MEAITYLIIGWPRKKVRIIGNWERKRVNEDKTNTNLSAECDHDQPEDFVKL